MGIVFACCRRTSSESELLTPSVETKRRQQAEAAERRLREQESRGIKDPERLKQKMKRLEELEKKQELTKSVHQDNTKLTIDNDILMRGEGGPPVGNPAGGPWSPSLPRDPNG